MWTDLVLLYRAAVIYELSADSGASSDAISPVLQMLTVGASLSEAREARAKEYEQAHIAVPTGLRDPVLVFGMPRGWKLEVHQPAEQVPKLCRAWSFVHESWGVKVNRSERLSIREALDFMLAAVF